MAIRQESWTEHDEDGNPIEVCVIHVCSGTTIKEIRESCPCMEDGGEFTVWEAQSYHDGEELDLVLKHTAR